MMQMDNAAPDLVDTDTRVSDPMKSDHRPITAPNESGLSGEVVSDVSDPAASDHVPVAAPVVLTESDRTPAHINPRAAVAGRESRAREPVPYTWFQPKRDEAREKHAQHGNPAGRWPRRTRAAMAKRNEAAQAQGGVRPPRRQRMASQRCYNRSLPWSLHGRRISKLRCTNTWERCFASSLSNRPGWVRRHRHHLRKQMVGGAKAGGPQGPVVSLDLRQKQRGRELPR